MKIWKVGKKKVIADGPAGAGYLAKDLRNNPIFIKKVYEEDFRLRVISKDELSKKLHSI